MTTVVVAGTGTEVGKTWVAVRLVAALRAAGVAVAARKPVQSFEPGDEERGATDAQLLAAATGVPAAEVCPPARWYPVAMAPPMAAAVLGLDPPTIAALLADLRAGAGTAPEATGPATDVVVVETVGGVRSPLAIDGDTVDLVGCLDPDLVVLVADAGLGTVNAVRLATGALAATGCRVAVFLNRYDDADDLHRRNQAWLRDVDALPVHTDLEELAAEIVRSGR